MDCASPSSHFLRRTFLPINGPSEARCAAGLQSCLGLLTSVIPTTSERGLLTLQDSPCTRTCLHLALCAMRRPEQLQQRAWTKWYYSITSSAATSRPGGIVRPSVVAVLRLTIVSNLVAAW